MIFSRAVLLGKKNRKIKSYTLFIRTNDTYNSLQLFQWFTQNLIYTILLSPTKYEFWAELKKYVSFICKCYKHILKRIKLDTWNTIPVSFTRVKVGTPEIKQLLYECHQILKTISHKWSSENIFFLLFFRVDYNYFLSNLHT